MPIPNPTAQLTGLIARYQLTDEAVAAGLEWPLDRTQVLLGTRSPHTWADWKPTLGRLRVERLAVACALLRADCTAARIARVLDTDAAREWLAFAARCRDARVPYWVGGPFPRSRWPESYTHERNRLAAACATLGSVLSRNRPASVRAWQRWAGEATRRDARDTLAAMQNIVGGGTDAD